MKFRRIFLPSLFPPIFTPLPWTIVVIHLVSLSLSRSSGFFPGLALLQVALQVTLQAWPQSLLTAFCVKLNKTFDGTLNAMFQYLKRPSRESRHTVCIAYTCCRYIYFCGHLSIEVEPKKPFRVTVNSTHRAKKTLTRFFLPEKKIFHAVVIHVHNDMLGFFHPHFKHNPTANKRTVGLF